MCVFEFTGGGGGPRHLHHDQDEWIYVIDGEFEFEVGEKRFRLGAGESVFMPRKMAHVWACVSGKPAKIINVYQPAGKMEEFFRTVGKLTKDLPTQEQVRNKTYTEEQKARCTNCSRPTGWTSSARRILSNDGRRLRATFTSAKRMAR